MPAGIYSLNELEARSWQYIIVLSEREINTAKEKYGFSNVSIANFSRGYFFQNGVNTGTSYEGSDIR